jgi:ubiquinone/menaquinone biosynthesis methyltransferase
MIDLYDTRYLQALFDEMQSTYECVSTLTSFGFNRRWRKQLIALLNLQRGMHVGDLMTGSGETWIHLLQIIGESGQLTAVDFSRQMLGQARNRQHQFGTANITVLEENALASSIAPYSVDGVVCAYGVKTLSPAQEQQFVHEIARILKPGGIVGLVEVSVPAWRLLRIPYLFYLTQIIPIVGKLLLGNPDNYRMLGVYTTKFGNCRRLQSHFTATGFEVSYRDFFGGCASALVGHKPG